VFVSSFIYINIHAIHQLIFAHIRFNRCMFVVQQCVPYLSFIKHLCDL
jgi:hypothetical protein